MDEILSRLNDLTSSKMPECWKASVALGIVVDYLSEPDAAYLNDLVVVEKLNEILSQIDEANKTMRYV
jgi:hypothetical protein